MNFDILQCYNVGALGSEKDTKPWLSRDVMEMIEKYTQPQLYAVRSAFKKLTVHNLSKLEMIYEIGHKDLSNNDGLVRRSYLFRNDPIVAIPSSHRLMALCNVETKEINNVDYQYAYGIDKLSFSADDKQFALFSNHQDIVIFDIPSSKKICTLKIRTWALTRVKMAYRQKIIALGYEDGLIQLYDISTCSAKASHTPLYGSKSCVSCIDFSADDTIMVSGEDNGRIMVTDLPDKGVRFMLPHSHGRVNSFAITPDKNTCISGAINGHVCVWNLNKGALVHVLTAHTSLVDHLAMHPNGKYVASSSHDDTIRVWNIHRGTCTEVIVFKDKLDFSAICYTQTDDLVYLF